MWVLSLEIPDAYMVAILGAALPSMLLAAAWAFNRIGNHERDIAVMQKESLEQDKDLADHENRIRTLEQR